MKKSNLTVAGFSLRLIHNQPEELMQKIAGELTVKLQKMRSSGGGLNLTAAALVLLIQDMIAETSAAEAVNALTEQVAALKSEIASLQAPANKNQQMVHQKEGSRPGKATTVEERFQLTIPTIDKFTSVETSSAALKSSSDGQKLSPEGQNLPPDSQNLLPDGKLRRAESEQPTGRALGRNPLGTIGAADHHGKKQRCFPGLKHQRVFLCVGRGNTMNERQLTFLEKI
ncbi:hypothetical protein [Mageeibacillus indolicus]|uniref:hypothetical protein n=1 Tax=Mageeibacillus indolicus TaxID=884684 RepID=UPI0012DF4DDD|nr:hypothetical protein [Mageeibacillus indolicus]